MSENPDWRDSGIVIEDELPLEECSNLDTNTATPLAQHQDDDGDTILHIAVVACCIDKVKQLLKDCSLNLANTRMETPLTIAVMANRPEMVELLISAGANVYVRNKTGDTILHLACQRGFKEVVDIVLNHIGASIERKKFIELANYDGLTCLHLAAIADRKEILSMLVNKYGSDVNIQDKKSGETILHKALAKPDPNLVECILQFEKHCNRPDYSGRRPLETIEKILQYTCNKVQEEKLHQASQLIRQKLKTCIENGGCCEASMLKQTLTGSYLDYRSSSSDYTDSEPEVSA